jgi:protein TonB
MKQQHPLKPQPPTWTSLFGYLGLVLALAIVWVALGYKTYQSTALHFSYEGITNVDNEVVPITFAPTPKQPQPVAVKQTANHQHPEIDDDWPDIDYKSNLPDQPESDWDGLKDWDTSGSEADDAVLVISAIQQRPIFPGCEDEWDEEARFRCFQHGIKQFVSNNFIVPQTLRNQSRANRIYIHFIIEKDGRITNPQVLGTQDESLIREAMKTIQSLPKMEPGKQQGRPVRTAFTLPLNLSGR